MIQIKCPSCNKNLDLEFQFGVEEIRISNNPKQEECLTKTRLWRAMWGFTIIAFLESLLIIVGINVLFKSLEINWFILLLFFTGFLLNLTRSWIKYNNNTRYGRYNKPRCLRDLWQTFFFNYPFIFICVYYIMSALGIKLFVIPLLIGWSIDHIWNNGNLFGGLKGFWVYSDYEIASRYR